MLCSDALSLLEYRDWITNEMRVQDKDAFEAREPHSRRVQRTPLVSLGIHHEWSGDGHDKLAAIGFPKQMLTLPRKA